MYINGHNLCIGCMRPLREDGTCSFCGFKQEEYNPIPRCLTPGTTLAGRYVTGRVLGEGSFGITYMGWDKRMDIPVAIKEYFPSDMVSRDVICGSDNQVYLYENEKKKDYDRYLEKFLNEAKCLSQFNQVEGIVSVWDFFYENNTAYLVMQHVDGISVKAYVRKYGKISAKHVLEAMRPVLFALEQVHGAGIIHRDISPDNMMMTKKGSLVLIDFGAARLRNIDYTKTMTVMYKRGFSPEEQYRVKGKWGAYTDVYSICATMYFMMTGEAPVDSVIRALGDDMKSLVPMKDLDISVSQRRAVMKGLEVSARNRWQTVGELYGALFDEVGEEEKRNGKQRFYAKWGVGALLFVLAAGAVFGFTTMRQVGEDAAEKKNIPADTAEVLLPAEVTETPDVREGVGAKAEADKKVKKVTVPKLTGLTRKAAKEKLQRKNLICHVKRVKSEEKEGTVIRQSLRAGKKTEPGTRVTITVSKGKEPEPTPTPRKEQTRHEDSDKAANDNFAGVIR